MTPEQKARIEIDKKLTASGWLVQDKKEFNPATVIITSQLNWYSLAERN